MSDLTAGIDIGSRTTAAVLARDGKCVGSALVETGTRPQNMGTEALEKALEECGESNPRKVVTTGYGRFQFSSYKTISEITCQAWGAYYTFPRAALVVDVGGQDSKVILVRKGKVIDFAMNDKCAAGTGRYLEMMAQALGVSLEECISLARRGKGGVKLSSTCAVFAESELISLVAAGKTPEDIARAVTEAVARRVVGLIRRVGVERPLVLTGGVARNQAVVRALAEEMGFSPLVPPEPQLTCAIGAALLAARE